MATTGGSEDGPKNPEKKVRDETQRQRWTGRGDQGKVRGDDQRRGRGDDQRRGRGYNSQRGQNRRNYHRKDEHDDRTGSGDNGKETRSDRAGGSNGGKPERQDQEQAGEKQMSYRRNRDSRSNQDVNWRNPAPSDKQEGAEQSESSSSRSDKGRRKHPDRQIYKPRSARSQNQEEKVSDSSNKTGSSHENSRPRRTETRPGYKSGRNNVQGESKSKRVIVRERRPNNKSEDGVTDKPRGRGSSKDNHGAKNKSDAISEEELWGDEGGEPIPKKEDEMFEKIKIQLDESKAASNITQSSEYQKDRMESRYLDKQMAAYIASGESANDKDSSSVPGLRMSPTIGLAQNPPKNMYAGKAEYGIREIDSPTYADAPIGVNAFGLYQDPYSIPYPGPGDFDGAAAMQYANEVSIGRGARWNEWHHSMWHDPSADQRAMHEAGRGFDPNRGHSGRGRGYQNRQGVKQDRKKPLEDISDTVESKKKDLGKSGKNVFAQEFHPRNFSMPQPGFIRKGQEKSDSRQKPAKKPKSGPVFSGSSETQTGTMIEQLSEGTYECLVCCDVVKCEARVWSCASCYTVFHLKCIKEWAKSPAAAAEDSDGWKCPACRNVTVHIPYVYKCFCAKSRDPPWEPGDTPHSCGEVCKRKRNTANCRHPCNILCHPGPCPQCPANVKRSCVCGKTKQTVRCGAVPVLRCQKACNKLLNCAIHVCEKVCHDDKCEECQIKISQECFCGKEKREIVCGSSPDAEEGAQKFSCEKECGRDLDCENHKCRDPCHLGDCDPCPLTPEAVKHCPCGQTLLDKLLELGDHEKRTKCTDPIATCQKTCGKPLLCGGDSVHTCKQDCHEGDCGPCDGTSMARCRCGHRFIDIPCAKITKDSANAEHICDRKCTKRKSCGKHKCQQKCCIDSSHLCMQMCARKLNCGIHVCEVGCHPGNCIRCLEASFEELFCHCGASVLMPPIPCGTKPPECTQQCVRRHNCKHTVRHTCHSEEECPPCAELTSKTCMGGHELRHNLPCYIEEVSCGNPCGKPLPCRQHTCQKTCHRGFCGGECSQPCPIPRPGCGHPCNSPCHPDTPCPKQQRCKAKFTIKCACGHLSESSQCFQGIDDSQLTEAYQKMTTSAVASQLKFGQSSVDISKLMAFRDDKGQRILECSEECSRIDRIRRFADALNINDPDMTGNCAPNYIPWLKDQAKKLPTFVSSVEKDFAAVVKIVQTKYTSRSHSFAPMNRDQRRTIHELSDFYGLESQSYDEEPKRNVVVTARRDKCHVPLVTLTAVVQQELHPKAPTPIPHNSKLSSNKLEVLRPTSKASKVGAAALERKKSEEEVIDYFDMT